MYICTLGSGPPTCRNPLCNMQIERKYNIRFDSKWPIEAIGNALSAAQRVVVVAHQNADGDAVGATCGMGAMLRRVTAAKVTAMLPDGVPDDLCWIPGADSLLDASRHTDACLAAIAEADLIVALDVNAFDRTRHLAQPLGESRATKLLVDHHLHPDPSAFNLIVSEPEASSTCELVYWLGSTLYGSNAFDTPAATALYTGICTDTGTFAYTNDRPSLYLATADLLGYGIDPMRINRQIRNNMTARRMHFYGFALSERLTVDEAKGVALMTLSQTDLAQHGIQSHEVTGLINEVMRLQAVDCAVLVREEADSVRLSIRSKEHHDANLLAASLFGGGGHMRAAGATSHLSLADTVKKVKGALGLEA